MDYQLAKKLRDSGFPQNHDFRISVWGIDSIFHNRMCTKCSSCKGELCEACIPSLLELIEACGESFSTLNHIRRDRLPISSGLGDEHDMVWEACCWEKSIIADIPEEAVARLWLELNKN